MEVLQLRMSRVHPRSTLHTDENQAAGETFPCALAQALTGASSNAPAGNRD